MDHSVRNQSECYSGKMMAFEAPQITSQMIYLLGWPRQRQIGSQGFLPFSYQYQSFSLCDSSCQSNSQLCTTEAFSPIINCSYIIPRQCLLATHCGLWSRSPTWIQGTLHMASFLCGPSSSCLARITMPFTIMRASASWEQKLRCITELYAPKSKPTSPSVSHVKTHALRKKGGFKSEFL